MLALCPLHFRKRHNGLEKMSLQALDRENLRFILLRLKFNFDLINLIVTIVDL